MSYVYVYQNANIIKKKGSKILYLIYLRHINVIREYNF